MDDKRPIWVEEISEGLSFKISNIYSSNGDEKEFYATLSERKITITLGEANSIENQDKYSLKVNLEDPSVTKNDLIYHGSSKKPNEDNESFKIFNNNEKKYLNQILALHKGSYLEFKGYHHLFGFLFLCLLDEVLSKSNDKGNNSHKYRNLIKQLISNYLFNFLIKRMLYYKYKDFENTLPYLKAVKEYYIILTEDKLEDNYPPNLLSEGRSYWFPHIEQELVEVVNCL